MHFVAFEEHMADTVDRNKLVCEVRRNTNVLLQYLDFHSYFEAA